MCIIGVGRVMHVKEQVEDIFEVNRYNQLWCLLRFEKWGIDVVGSLSRTQHGREFILVVIIYMAKWVDVVATSSIKVRCSSICVQEYFVLDLKSLL